MRGLLLACAVLLLAAASSAGTFRAALDFTFRIDDGSYSEEITCDFCGYRFRDGTGELFTLSVNAERGYVDVFFFESATRLSSECRLSTSSQEPIESSSNHFAVGYCRKARVREGQTLELRGGSIEFTLVDAFGGGCPAGVQC